MPNIWGQVGGVNFALPMETLLGNAHQLLGMNAAADALQYKNAKFNSTTQQLYVPVGTAAVPPYSFEGDLDAGFYNFITSLGTRGIGFSTGGSRRGYVTDSLWAFETVARMVGAIFQEDKGANIVAAATTDLANATGNYIYVTHAAGVLAITSLGGATVPAGTEIEMKMSIAAGTLSFTHNAVSLICLGGGDVSLEDGDVVRWRKISDADAYWEMVGFQRGVSSSVLENKGDLLVGRGGGASPEPLAVGTDGEVPVAEAGGTLGIVWGAPSQGCRQTVLTGSVDGNGYANFLSAGAGLNFNIAATATPLVLSFADGFGLGGAKDLVTQLSVDASNQGSLEPSNINFIYATRASKSTVSWGNCLIPPQYGYAFDRTQGALLNFEGADASTTILDDFGNTWTVNGNAQIDTAQFKFGSSSLLLDGTGDNISSTNFVTLGQDSWEISCWIRPAAVGVERCVFAAQNAAFVGAVVILNAAGTLALRLSSDASSNNIGNISGATVLVANTWYKIRVVFDALAGTYRLYLSNNGAAETQEVNIASAAKVCAITSFKIGDGGGAAAMFNGWIDAFRFIHAATKTSTETPAAAAPAITDHKVHFFSVPSMKMYEVTAASAGTGQNPTLTAVTRLFLGEADTSGVAVTAVRNYAIRGMYIGESTLGAQSTKHFFNHNIGVSPAFIQQNVRLKCKTAQDGYFPGELLEPMTLGNANYATGKNQTIKSRNIMLYVQGDQAPTGLHIVNATTGQSTSVGSTEKFSVLVEAHRTF